MRVPRLGLAIVYLACAGLLSGKALQITTTPSHTATPTPTITPTPTPTLTTTNRPTPWAAASPEFPVNETTGLRNHPAVALGAENRFMAVWQSEGNGDSEIHGRVYDSSGAPLGGEFQVNTTTEGHQWIPAIAANPSGDFVVVWVSSTTQGDGDIRAQVFDPMGAPIGTEILVNAYTTGHQVWPDVAYRDDGFTIVWMSDSLASDPDGVYLRRFSLWGTPQGDEVLVNTYTTGYQSVPKVSSSMSGTVVVWQSADQDGDMNGIYAQLYDEPGSPHGPEFRINSLTAGDQTSPDVAMGDGREFITVWRSSGDATGIYGRGFNISEVFTGPEFRISDNGSGYGGPKVAIDQTEPGGFVVAWSGLDESVIHAPHSNESVICAPNTPPPQNTAIFAQRFGNAPFPTTSFYYVQPPRRGETLQVDTHTYQSQSFPGITCSWDGRFVVAWQSDFENATRGIQVRRFDFPDALPMKVDVHASGGSSNLNGVLEAGERVVVEPAWRMRGFTPIEYMSATASNVTGPAGSVHTIDDATADYGAIGYDGSNCFNQTGDCYEISVGGARAAAHWDATFEETLHPLDPQVPTSKTWALHVGGSFADVPQDSFYLFIENLFHNGVTAGGGCGPGLFCGDEPVLRQQMAVFLLKAAYGQGFLPSDATGGVFEDVPAASPFAPWIEELARIGVTAGCSSPPPPALPSFCPATSVNRQQMAVFLKAYWGSGFSPALCDGLFEDVPCANPFAPYVEYLTGVGIAAGCSASPPLYCPTDPTKRKQMAVFLVKTFGLALYGPD